MGLFQKHLLKNEEISIYTCTERKGEGERERKRKIYRDQNQSEVNWSDKCLMETKAILKGSANTRNFHVEE